MGCRAPTQVDRDSDPGLIHDSHRSLQMPWRGINMLVQIDDSALGSPLVGGFQGKGGRRLVSADD
jgi:hypothetical protein